MCFPKLEGLAISYPAFEFFNSVNEAIDILKLGLVATTAADNGAINVYKNDEGFYHCEAMRNCASFSKEEFSNLTNVRMWLKKYISEIK